MNNIAKNTIILMIATILAKVLGFVRELVLASCYGASMYSDAYITAMNIPQVIFAIIGAAIVTTFIPMYFEVKSELDEKKALEFTNNSFNIVALICIILAIIGIVFAEPIVKIFAFGFDAKTFDIAVKFTRVIILSIVFIGASYMMTAYLQIKNNFTVPGLIGVPKNLIIIVSIILSIKFGPYIMIWGALIGTMSEFVFQLPFARKSGYKYKLYINVKDKYIKKIIYLLGPIIIGVSVNQINAMIDRSLASGLAEGSISALNYANKLSGFVIALFITSIGSVIFPILSKLQSEDKNEVFIESVRTSINSVIALIIPISIGAITLSRPIVKLLFQRGAFDSRATEMTSIALIMYSLGMLFFGLTDILGKVFYSLKDTKTPMVNGTIAMIINIILNLVLVNYLDLAGLALATSISSMVCVMLLFRSLKRKISYYGQYEILRTTIKVIISSTIMMFVTKSTYNYTIYLLGTGLLKEIIALLLSISLSILVYIILIIMLKVEEINIFINKVKNKQKNYIKKLSI